MNERRLRDVDSAEQVYRLKSLLWALVVGLFMGVPAGLGAAKLMGGDLIVGALLGFPIAVAAVYFGSQALAERAGAAAQTLYNPSAKSTPRRQEYSYAASLVARGRYEEAAAAYELHCIEQPENPEPYFQLARLYKDHLNEPLEAIAWYRRARADATLRGAQELVAIQEIIEIYANKLQQPRKVIPELALLCERFPDTPAAKEARRSLEEMRGMLAQEHEGGARFTQQFLKKIDRSRLSTAAGYTREELERQMITDALRECDGDRQRAANQLGIPLEKLAQAMRDLGLDAAGAAE